MFYLQGYRGKKMIALCP